MKKCDKCKEVKEKKEFYKNKFKSDGFHSDCKTCSKKRLTERRLKNPDEYLAKKKAEYQKNKEKYHKRFKDNYYKNRQERLIKLREFARKEENKEKARIRNREFKRRKRELIAAKLLIEEDYKKRQRSAVDKVCYGVKTGKLIKPKNCEACFQETDLQGHHDDYKKPLDVRWLCMTCHMKQHKKLLDVLW